MSVIIIIFRDPGNIQWEIFSIPKICRLASSYMQDSLNRDPHFVLAVSDPRVYIICVDTRPRLQSCGAHDEFDRWAEWRTHFTLLILTLNVSGRVWPVSGNIPLYFYDSLIEIYIHFLIIISTTHQGTISFIAHFSWDSTSSSVFTQPLLHLAHTEPDTPPSRPSWAQQGSTDHCLLDSTGDLMEMYI